MNRRSGWIALAVAAAAVLLVAGFFTTFERKNVVETEPSHGEARYNRFFALQEILEELGLPARSLTRVDPKHLPLTAGDTLLIGADASRIGPEDAARITKWVDAGGHLLLSPGAGTTTNVPLFEMLGLIEPAPGKRGCSTLKVDAETAKDQHASLCGARFRLTASGARQLEAFIGDGDVGYLFARVRSGEGTVSLLASFAPLSRQNLKTEAAQHLAWRLLAPNRSLGTTYLVYALDGPGFLGWLLIHGWPALLALSILLIAWMIMRSARVGPLLPHPTPHRRALLEHVHAAGEFLYRRDAGRSLHRLACDAAVARLRRRDPSCRMLNGDALYTRMAERSAIDAERIVQAFQSPANAQAFRTSILILARLGSRP